MSKPRILYDSHCIVCNKEIEYYKRKDIHHTFEYLDIMNPKFSAENYGLTKQDVHRYFHVINREGRILSGVDAFNYIWKELDTFSLLQKIYSIELGKSIMKIGYDIFVRIRPYLPRKKDCGDYCEF